MMAADALEQLHGADAIYLGAIGHPSVPDHVSVWELILPIRQRFEQYVNLRPMRLMPGVLVPARRPRLRRHRHGLRPREQRGRVRRRRAAACIAARRTKSREQTGVFTRMGIERVLRYAFKQAQSRPRKMLASATKSNALQHSMVLWDEVADEVATEFPDVTMRKYHVDALAARMVTHPQTLDVMVASNLFGDILTDLGAAVSGSLGVAPGANLNPDAALTRRCSSRFTARRRTSPARASPTRSARSGPGR